MFKKKDALWFVVLKIVLNLTYICLHKDLFGYYGFDFDLNIYKTVISWVLFVFVAVCISSNTFNCRTLFLYTTMCLGLTPAFVYYEYNIEAETWMLVSQAAMLLLMHFLMNKTQLFMRFKVKKLPYYSSTVRFFAGSALVLYFLYAFIKYGIPRFDLLSFETVSEIRHDSSISTLMSIVQNFVCRVLGPIMMMLLFMRKKWVSFCLVLIVQLYTYSVTGFKTFLFIPLVVIALSFFDKLDVNKLMLRAIPIVCVLCSLVYVIFDQIYPYALVNERVLFLPAKIKYSYFDYFSQNKFVYFSQSTIGLLLGIESTYKTAIPNLIGDVYFNKPEMWTNTGFMADAYSNMGFMGMLLIAVFLSALISLADIFMAENDSKLNRGLMGMFLIFFISLNDGSAITVFFSGGMIFALLTVCMISFKSTELS